MIVTKLQQEIIGTHAKRKLGRELTKRELEYVMVYYGQRLAFLRNKYYRDINTVVEEAIKEVAENDFIY